MNSDFIVIENESEIQNAQNLFLDLMKNQATEQEIFTIYFPGSIHDKFEILWFKEFDFWYGYKIIEEKNKKHRNVFGKGKLVKIKYANPSIPDFQINTPISGYNKRLGGVFVKDTENHTYIAYNGRIGGFIEHGIGSKENEIKFKETTSFQEIIESKGRELFLISKLDETLVPNLAKLTEEINLIKSKTNVPSKEQSSKNTILSNLENKGITKTHTQILRKFLVYEGQTITDVTKLRGVKGVSPIPPDSIVSEPHYMHNMVRGVYKPKDDEYALSIQMNPQSIWGSEIDFETGKWKIDYDFGEEGKYSSDMLSLKKCFDSDVPIGVINKLEKGVNKILGLGKISSIEGTKFTIIPYEIDDKISQVENLSATYASNEISHGDFSAQGSESTVYVRAKQGKFKEILLQEYDSKCAFCEFNEPEYLIGAHIIPYKIMRKEDPKNAMNPADGILLCKLCDIAFENGDILLQENHEVTISQKLTKSENSSVTSWLSKINSKIPIKSGSKFTPEKEFIQKKLELVS
jgi:hypothetical protein